MKKPPPAIALLVWLLPFRSKPAPALTVRRLVAGMAFSTPERSRPAATVTPAPPRLASVVAPVSTRMPLPALVRPVEPLPAVEVRAPLSVAVTAGLVTVIVRFALPRLTGAASVMFEPLRRPPKVKSPRTLTGLLSVRAVPSVFRVVPAPILKMPVPIGLLVMTEPVRTVLPAIISVPPFRLKGAEKVFAPLRARTPAPALVREPIVPLWVIGAEISRPVSVRPALTVMTGAAWRNCNAVPVMAGVVT